ncbi:hypothetical protein SK128_022386, partial [Halocaridina rubra]
MKVSEWLSKLRKGSGTGVGGGDGGSGKGRRKNEELLATTAASISTPILLHSTSHLLNPPVGIGRSSAGYPRTAASASTPVLPHACSNRGTGRGYSEQRSPSSDAVSVRVGGLRDGLGESQFSSGCSLFYRDSLMRHSISSSNRSSNRSTLSQSSCNSVSFVPDRPTRPCSAKKPDGLSRIPTLAQNSSDNVSTKHSALKSFSQSTRSFLSSENHVKKENCGGLRRSATVSKGSGLSRSVGSVGDDRRKTKENSSFRKKEGSSDLRKAFTENQVESLKEEPNGMKRTAVIRSSLRRPSDSQNVSAVEVGGEKLKKKDSLSSSFRFFRKPEPVSVKKLDESKKNFTNRAGSISTTRGASQHTTNLVSSWRQKTPQQPLKTSDIKVLGNSRPLTVNEGMLGKVNKTSSELGSDIQRHRSFRVLRPINIPPLQQQQKTHSNSSNIAATSADKKTLFSRSNASPSIPSNVEKCTKKPKTAVKITCKNNKVEKESCHAFQRNNSMNKGSMNINKTTSKIPVTAKDKGSREDPETNKSHNIERRPSVRSVLETYGKLQNTRRSGEQIPQRPTALYIPDDKTNNALNDRKKKDIKKYLLEYDEPGAPISVIFENIVDSGDKPPTLPKKRTLSPNGEGVSKKSHKPSCAKDTQSFGPNGPPSLYQKTSRSYSMKENLANGFNDTMPYGKVQKNLPSKKSTINSSFEFKEPSRRFDNYFPSQQAKEDFIRGKPDLLDIDFGDLDFVYGSPSKDIPSPILGDPEDDPLEIVMRALEEKSRPVPLFIKEDDSSEDDFVDLDEIIIDLDLRRTSNTYEKRGDDDSLGCGLSFLPSTGASSASGVLQSASPPPPSSNMSSGCGLPSSTVSNSTHHPPALPPHRPHSYLPHMGISEENGGSSSSSGGGGGASQRLGSPERPEKSIKVHNYSTYNVVKFGDGTDVK